MKQKKEITKEDLAMMMQREFLAINQRINFIERKLGIAGGR